MDERNAVREINTHTVSEEVSIKMDGTMDCALFTDNLKTDSEGNKECFELVYQVDKVVHNTPFPFIDFGKFAYWSPSLPIYPNYTDMLSKSVSLSLCLSVSLSLSLSVSVSLSLGLSVSLSLCLSVCLSLSHSLTHTHTHTHTHT